jgi:histidinol-phosphate aminotransferase
MQPADLLRSNVAGMEAYTPIVPFEVLSRQLGRRPDEIVKLDANENPYGPVQAVREALASYPYLHIYPDPEQRELRDALAGYTGLPAGNILPGHGADELIDLLCRSFAGPGDAVVNCPPTFGMYRFDAALAGARVVDVPRGADFAVDVSGVEQVVHGMVNEADGPYPKLLFLTSPNNPDGSLLSSSELERLLALPLMVIVDEAYIEFAGRGSGGAEEQGGSVALWVLTRENLIVLRTFSKWAGIAGLRLGYGLFPDWLMPALWKAKQPYNVNVAATVAGLTALQHTDEILRTVGALVRERERLQAALAEFPFLTPYPSRANFVLCRVEGRSALTLKKGLEEQGILVRYYAQPGLENYIRISAGRPDQTDALLGALRVVA